ncbi:Phenylalanyl-tRNA synthetase beta chain [Enhygromyxa salina]|uniref:Phenylalanine--tRNA ligase beta subunit n=1 Tax=Enhygromyxa salina TaxID=215803 RepID=A0A0C2DI58_9BACT|nr:phenylalanine--tRNA ligase subunit beta [Enhygromyxa salina]KIG19362.1 Phenylalanyl-tRNA synthetase beta chain [Enhygromyxa salina]
MLLSCTWLSELLGRPLDVSPPFRADDPFSAVNIAARLTNLGLEVEGIEYFELPKIIVGRVDEVTPHPDASKLNIVQLFDGARTIQVVCGASNLPPVGGKVAFAPVGAVLPDGLELSERELRGVVSNGMICSETELRIGSDGEGILVLPREWEPGALLQDLVPGIRDAVIEISVTPNRPDALGHLGVARDLALALGCELTLPAVPVPVPDTAKAMPELVTLEAGDRCPRYLGYALEDCSVGASPLWLRVRLHRVGLRARNNVVDVTNLVLFETGQPMHAFDRQRLDGERVVVRTATAGEPITTLDGIKLELSDDDLVIADAKAPQALAGVMGGEGSMVGEGTTRLLLEVAFFEPRAIRRSARRYALRTDSSHRFERQVDFAGQLELAAARAVSLLHQISGARCVAYCDAQAKLPVPAPITLDPDHVGRLLGMDIAADEIARILQGLGVTLDQSNAQAWRCEPPSFRPDLGRNVDLIEEVMRHHGLDELPARHSSSPEELMVLPEDPVRRLADALTDGLRANDLHEHVSLAFTAEDQAMLFASEAEPPRSPDDFQPTQLVRPVNPMRLQQGCMRPHLLPGLLDAVAYNLGRHTRALGLFEVGRVYLWPLTSDQAAEPTGPTAEIDRCLPTEPYRAAAIRAQRASGSAPAGELARAVTRDLSAALARVGLHAQLRAPAQPRTWLHPGVQVGLWIGDRQVGVAGELHPDLLAARDLSEHELGYGELWLEALPPLPTVQFADVARFPGTTRDLSLDLDQRISSAAVLAALTSAAADSGSSTDDPPRLANADEPRRPIELIEDYRGAGVEAGRHALLLRLNYRAGQRSVTDAEVQALHDKVVAGALEQLTRVDPAARVR